MSDAALFEVIRDIKGSGLTQAEVDRVNAILHPPGIAGAGQSVSRGRFDKYLVAAAGRPMDDTMRKVAKALEDKAADYGQDATMPRLAEFIAQIANETGGFRRWSENLNYSAKRMTQVWPGRFPTIASAQPYERNPEALANKTYGGRMGNTQPGDGWKYRGRGALQLTGRNNYTLYGRLTGVDLVNKPELAEDPYYSTIIAMEFFKQGKVNNAVDRGDFREARRITNGGSIGLEEVGALRRKVLAA
tara:strand:- start:9375 stop:10112 length:738 start_codon:yes stop_codon:yes gene_type:complete